MATGFTSPSHATVAFIDIAGFSAITEVYGDVSALAMLELFEGMVSQALADYEPPIKWIGDEVMLSFEQPADAIRALGNLLEWCRNEPRLPLTRTSLNHGPVLRRGSDLFGSTVNIAARIAALAGPGQLLATGPVAQAASALGIATHDLGKVPLRSVVDEVQLFDIRLGQEAEPRWIDPVCKMHAPYEVYQRAVLEGPWFCSPHCEEAYRKSPQTYPPVV